MFRVAADLYREGELDFRSAMTYLALSPTLQRDFPEEVEGYTRLLTTGGLLHIEEKHFREDFFFYADASLPQIFSLDLMAGSAAHALVQPNMAILSESAARKYFGTPDCLGRSIRIENSLPGDPNYQIAGIYRDIPENAHLRSDIFLSLSTLTQVPDFLPDWAWRDFYNYVLLRPGAAERLSRKISAEDYVGKYFPAYPERHLRHELYLQPVSDIHLHSNLEMEMSGNGDARTLNYLLLIGAFVLCMAWSNYLILVTARAVREQKNVGIRKAVGANRNQLTGYYLTQSLLLHSSALSASIGLAALLQPGFEQVLGRSVPFSFFSDPALLATCGAFVGIGTLLSCLYPAWLQAGFSAARIFQHRILRDSREGIRLRQGLIVFQFAVSVILMVASAVIFRQLDFMKTRDLGMNLDQTLVMHVPITRDSAAQSALLVFKNMALRNPNVEAVSLSHLVPGDESLWTPGIRPIGADGSPAASRIVFVNSVDATFVPAFGMKILAGRNFYDEVGSDRNSMLLTETACRSLGFTSPEQALNRRYLFFGEPRTVVGVVSDYQQWGVQRQPGDYVFVNLTDEYQRISIKTGAQNVASTLAFLEKTAKDVFPEAPFEYVFLDQHFARQYEAEQRSGTIALLFTAVAIFIACLGLFGLASHLVAQRTKEIGIRKVLGATIAGITGLLAKDFLKLVLLAILIALPLAWWAMNRWLEDFAQRIVLQWWLFALAATTALVIATLTVGFQSVRAALRNPVKGLRSE